jgi:hypothetical protein
MANGRDQNEMPSPHLELCADEAKEVQGQTITHVPYASFYSTSHCTGKVYGERDRRRV